jgi:RNA polymerase sigma-70 factor (ECF subfamily)
MQMCGVVRATRVPGGPNGLRWSSKLEHRHSRTDLVMIETSWEMLRQLLARKYDVFRCRLTRRLGSADLASEVLHEMWLRLDRNGNAGLVQSPNAYLFRTALNVATDRRRSDQRRAKMFEIQAALEIPDDNPGPAREAEARLEIQALEKALEELTPRRRMILLASRLEGAPLKEIAERLDVSQRLVEIELKHALEHCALRLERSLTRRFGPGARQTSQCSDDTTTGPPAPDEPGQRRLAPGALTDCR